VFVARDLVALRDILDRIAVISLCAIVAIAPSLNDIVSVADSKRERSRARLPMLRELLSARCVRAWLSLSSALSDRDRSLCARDSAVAACAWGAAHALRSLSAHERCKHDDSLGLSRTNTLRRVQLTAEGRFVLSLFSPARLLACPLKLGAVQMRRADARSHLRHAS
jgi:hypothetical protein